MKTALLLLLWAVVASPTEVWGQPPSNRPIDLWRALRNALTGEGRADYFGQIKDTLIPPEGMFDGTVVSQSSQTDIVVNVDNAAGDATLRFEHPLKGVVPGAPVHFRGVIDSYMKQPYMLSLRVQDEDLHP